MFILQVWAVSYNSDGSKVLSVSEDKQALVYSIPGNIASPKDLWFHQYQLCFQKVLKIQRTGSLHQTILASHKSPPKVHQNSNFLFQLDTVAIWAAGLEWFWRTKVFDGSAWVGLHSWQKTSSSQKTEHGSYLWLETMVCSQLFFPNFLNLNAYSTIMDLANWTGYNHV